MDIIEGMIDFVKNESFQEMLSVALPLLGILVSIILIVMYRKKALFVIFFVIPMLVAFPALIIALFKVSVILGVCAVLCGVAGGMLYTRTIGKYPLLKKNCSSLLRITGILITIITMVIGMHWGTNMVGTSGKLIVLFYGGIGVTLLAGTLVFAPYRIALHYNRVKIAKQLKPMPLNTPASLKSLITRMRISKPNWFLANIELLAGEGENYVLSPPGSGGRYIISANSYDGLKVQTEQHLLNHGSRDLMELSEEVTQHSTKSLFLTGILTGLVHNGIIDKVDIGQDPNVAEGGGEQKSVALRYVYSHKSKPMKSIVIDDDFD